MFGYNSGKSIQKKSYIHEYVSENNLNFAEILYIKDKSGENIQSNDTVFLIF